MSNKKGCLSFESKWTYAKKWIKLPKVWLAHNSIKYQQFALRENNK